MPAMPCNLMCPHAIPCNLMRPHAIPCNQDPHKEWVRVYYPTVLPEASGHHTTEGRRGRHVLLKGGDMEETHLGGISIKWQNGTDGHIDPY
jgi:hypothetical protein